MGNIAGILHKSYSDIDKITITNILVSTVNGYFLIP